MKKDSQLNELLLWSLKDLYCAELQLSKALPALTQQASSNRLARALRQLLQETEKQMRRLDTIFQQLKTAVPKGKKSEAMTGLLDEAKHLVDEYAKTSTADAALVSAIQKIAHYSIATYGCAVTWAHLLELDEIADLLRETLGEEKNCDRSLTELAEAESNVEAVSAV